MKAVKAVIDNGQLVPEEPFDADGAARRHRGHP